MKAGDGRADKEPTSTPAPSKPGRPDKEPAAPTAPTAPAAPTTDTAPPANAPAEPTSEPPPPPVSVPPTPSTRTPLTESDRATFTKPFLASEALIEDLAPLEPSRGAARLWCAALGGSFLLFGLLALLGLGPGGSLVGAPEMALGVISLITALMRLTYRQRAVTMIVLGVFSAVLGLRGTGITPGGHGWGLMRTLAGMILPGALLFRARYRAYARARWILGAALASALPFVIYSAARIAQIDPNGFGFDQSGAVIAVVAVGASLLGFMGSETTGGGTATALGVILALAADLVLQALAVPGVASSVREVANVVASSAAFAGTSAMASLGLFQILAWRFAADARRINLHQIPKQPRPRREPSGDWSTKE